MSEQEQGLREITHHQGVGGIDEKLTITFHPDYAFGNTCYLIHSEDGQLLAEIQFQQGPVFEKGVNGVTVKSLIAVCFDRLRQLNQGEWECDENVSALMGLSNALEWLHRRVQRRPL